jgi:hypothetical protein
MLKEIVFLFVFLALTSTLFGQIINSRRTAAGFSLMFPMPSTSPSWIGGEA